MKSVRALREHSNPEGCDCNVCPYYDAEERGYSTCSEELTEKAADAIEELSKPKWISVEERLPEEGKNVLVCICADGKYDITRGWYDKKQGFCCWDDATMESADFTKYWMQMPEPPKEDKP